MIVKQIYAGWIGIIQGDIVNNGVIQFISTSGARNQLEEYNPTPQELKRLERDLKANFPHERRMITEVKKWNLMK